MRRRASDRLLRCRGSFLGILGGLCFCFAGRQRPKAQLKDKGGFERDRETGSWSWLGDLWTLAPYFASSRGGDEWSICTEVWCALRNRGRARRGEASRRAWGARKRDQLQAGSGWGCAESGKKGTPEGGRASEKAAGLQEIQRSSRVTEMPGWLREVMRRSMKQEKKKKVKEKEEEEEEGFCWNAESKVLVWEQRQ